MDSESTVTPALTTSGITLSRGAAPFAALPDLAIAKGETIALTGASGTGKTTALMALAGIRAPHAGRVEINGTDLWQLGRSARDGFRGRRIGLVFQSFHLVDALTVAANVWLAAQCAGYPLHENDRLDQLLGRLRLLPVRNRRADRISHGQAQRVAVARALVNRPVVVLADEPTSALDDDNAAALMTLLGHAAQLEGAALVVATHDRRVLGTVDRVVEMVRAS
jgi:putative ABC transport system ATP-binding protein